MLKKLNFIFTTVLLASLSITAYAKDSPYIHYTISPDVLQDQPVLKLSLTFQAEQSTQTELILPSVHADHSTLYENIEISYVSSDHMDSENEPHIKLISHTPGEVIQIDYYVKQDFEGPLMFAEQGLVPLTQDTFFRFNGNSVFVYPNYLREQHNDIAVSLEWDLPNDWQVANSFSANESQQQLQTSIDKLLDGIYVGGEWDLITNAINGNEVVIAIRNQFQFSNKEFSDLVTNIIQYQRDFWQDHTQTHYLITVLPFYSEEMAFAGSGHLNAFDIVLPVNSHLDMGPGVARLLMHELLHNWFMPSLFAGYQATPVADRNYYWFSEGFNNFYTDLLRLRADIIDYDEYVDAYNEEALKGYFLSSVNTITNAELVEQFWTDFDIERMIYHRGHILAQNWDTEIRLASNGEYSMDDLMRDIITIPTQTNYLTFELIDKYSKKYLPNGVAGDLEKYIVNGELLSPHPLSMGDGYQLVTIETAPYRSGFWIEESLRQGIVSFINEDSKAYQLGLREGYQLTDIDYEAGNVLYPVTVTFHDGEQQQTIEYLPYEGELVEIPQFVQNDKL